MCNHTMGASVPPHPASSIPGLSLKPSVLLSHKLWNITRGLDTNHRRSGLYTLSRCWHHWPKRTGIESKRPDDPPDIRHHGIRRIWAGRFPEWRTATEIREQSPELMRANLRLLVDSERFSWVRTTEPARGLTNVSLHCTDHDKEIVE